MQRITHENGLITYTFDFALQMGIPIHISTRHGGVSLEPWNTLNFSVSRGDTRENVETNRQRLAFALGIETDEIVRCHQVHGTNVAIVGKEDAGHFLEQTDCLVTNAIGVPLSWVFADCVPIIFFDPIHNALGGCHAGWRGTINGAATATLWAMQAAYDTDPEHVLVGIGPSIGPESYEVGTDIVDLAHVKLKRANRFFTYPNGSDSNPTFDLWQANVAQLGDAGVSMDRIEIAEIDTAQNTNDFFSHRAEKGRCGLFAMVAWLDRRFGSG